MNKFLIVLGERETNWGLLLDKEINRAGGDATIVGQVENALLLLSKPDSLFNHVICGTISGEWPKVMAAARDRGISSLHLLTSIDSVIEAAANREGAAILSKSSFDNLKFIEKFFPQGGPKEAIK